MSQIQLCKYRYISIYICMCTQKINNLIDQFANVSAIHYYYYCHGYSISFIKREGGLQGG